MPSNSLPKKVCFIEKLNYCAFLRRKCGSDFFFLGFAIAFSRGVLVLTIFQDLISNSLQSQFPMSSTKFSDRIKQAKSTNEDIEAITQKLEKELKITDEPVSSIVEPEVTADVADEDDWEKLADKELDAPVPKTKPKAVPAESPILELSDFDPRLQMHQLVKDFTSIVDPTGTMVFRPKMVGQSLMFTFNNPKHGISYRMRVC